MIEDYLRRRTVRILLIAIAGLLTYTVTAKAGTTIGLTGGAPVGVAGQQRVANAGINVISWAGNQTPANPLVPGLALRVQLRTALELPMLNAAYWTTVDEPWLNGVDPSVTQQQVDVIHAAGGVALTNQGWSMDTRRWPTVAQIAAYPGDVVSVDSFPTLQHPYAEMGAKVRLMVSAARGRPVWAALQVCSRSNFATGRVPTAAQEWEMAKRALHAGATGIMFFGSGYRACLKTTLDKTSGFNWSAWLHTVLPTVRKIQGWGG